MAAAGSSRGRWLRLVPGQKPPAPMLRAEDEALIDAIQRGDRRLGDQLYGRLIRIVDATVYRIAGRKDPEHDDLVQTAFEQIVITIAEKKYAKACSLTSWAAAVTCNVTLHALRRRTAHRKVFDRNVELDGAVLDVGGIDVERTVAARRELERVRDHLSRMTPERAETLLLHDMLGKELSEIAVLTGVSVAAAQSRLVRGRHELVERMNGDPTTTEDA
ncbi:MAG TPA: RNA polymerase sigma factor [Polyangiaceae bacterium]|nr:RNA polymerase sigma factor [Polyangiaceae bacterium]